MTRLIAMVHALVVCSLSAACARVEEPPCPEIILPSGGDGLDDTCSCSAEAVEGSIFRVTRLEIDEPDAFAEILNLIWENDIRNNTLNVVIRVDDAVPGTPFVFNSLSVTLGPAWRNPKTPFALPAEVGLPAESAVESYCMLEGLSVRTVLKPYRGYLCQMKADTPAALYFHSGPKDRPLVCAPDNHPPNNIPVANLGLRVTFNRDCTAIQEGFIQGCITTEAADRICMCPGVAGSCPIAPEAVKPPFDVSALDIYCRGVCGEGWISFGGLVRAFGLLPSCLTPDGENGYEVQGFVSAVAIAREKYNPVSSDDCTAH